jgi:hypothetical protein
MSVSSYERAERAGTLELEEAQCEIDRLRDALERIVTHGDYTAPEGMKEIARKALGPNPAFQGKEEV